LVVNALATKIQIEQPLVVINFEIELLVHLASRIRSEHDINSLPLSRLQDTLSGGYLEPLSFSCRTC
jgi:hypothetical protein